MGGTSPKIAAGQVGRQMAHDAPHRAGHADSDLEEHVPQTRNGPAASFGLAKSPAKLLEKSVRRSRHEYAELVGDEAGAARAIHGEVELQLLDPVLAVAASAVPGVDVLR